MTRYGLQPREGYRDWGAIISGVLLAVVGVVFFAWPNGSLVTLTILSGGAFLVAGVFGFVSSYRLGSESILRPWTLTYGILDVVIGILLVVFPTIFSVVLPWLIAIAFVIFGVFEIASSLTLRKFGSSLWGIILATGIIGVLCAIMLFVAPESILVFMGIYLVVRGAMLLCNGLKKEYFPPR